MNSRVWIDTKYPGHCSECGQPIAAGEHVIWDAKGRKTYCPNCSQDLDDPLKESDMPDQDPEPAAPPIPAPSGFNYTGMLEQIAMSMQDLVAELRKVNQHLKELQ